MIITIKLFSEIILHMSGIFNQVSTKSNYLTFINLEKYLNTCSHIILLLYFNQTARMDVMLQRHCARYIYVVPDGLKELMSDISREVCFL